MKRSLIWTTTGAAIIGFGVPAYAAVQTSNPQPSNNTVQTNVEDISGPCDEAEHANDPRCATVTVAATQGTTATTSATTPATQGTQPSTSVDDSVTDDSVTDNSVDDSVTDNSVDDSVTDNSVDDSVTDNSVGDISGPCDEAEHANDPRCTGAAADSDDRHGGNDDSDDSDDSDNSGHGGSDDDD